MSEVSAQAWLLDFSRNQLAAVGLHELLEVLSRPKLYYVPMASARCHHVLVWRDEILPVVDFGADPARESDDEAPSGAVTAIAGSAPTDRRAVSYAIKSAASTILSR